MAAPSNDKAGATDQAQRDRDAILSEVRREDARQAEANAWSAEMHRRQWERLKAKGPAAKSVTGAEQQHAQFVRDADDARKRADAMHRLAGTTREIARDDVVRIIEGQREHFIRQLIRAEDAMAHPDAYGPQQNQGPEVWTAAIEACDELIAEVEKWATT